MGAIAFQITSLTIVYSTVYSGADQSKHQSCASLAFVWGIHRRPVNPPHKWPVTRKMFPFDDVITQHPHPGAVWSLRVVLAGVLIKQSFQRQERFFKTDFGNQHMFVWPKAYKMYIRPKMYFVKNVFWNCDIILTKCWNMLEFKQSLPRSFPNAFASTQT